jgi:predicted transcriptional regulator
MDQVFEDLKASLLQSMPVERRLEGISAKDILAYLFKLKNSQQLTIEELVRALPREVRAQLRELLERGEEAP